MFWQNFRFQLVTTDSRRIGKVQSLNASPDTMEYDSMSTIMQSITALSIRSTIGWSAGHLLERSLQDGMLNWTNDDASLISSDLVLLAGGSSVWRRREFSASAYDAYNSLCTFSKSYLSPCTNCFDGLSLSNDSNLSHAPHFALLALLSTLEKYSHMGFDFCDISMSILGLVDDSTKLYDTPYTRIHVCKRKLRYTATEW